MEKAIQIGYDTLFPLKCRLAAEAGFGGISVNFTQVLDKTEYQWEAITEEIGGILEESGLKCVQSHPYYYPMRISSELLEERCEFAIRQAIIASGRLGAPWCALHPRSSLTTGSYRTASLEDNRRVFSEYLELAAKCGTGIAAENLLMDGAIIPIIPFYCAGYDELLELTDSLSDGPMGICWDFGHANIMCFDQAYAISQLGSRIKCTHVHNNFQVRDSHLLPDQGNLPWERVMPALAKTGYDGPLTLEVHCAYEDPELLASFARHSYSCLRFLEQLATRT